MAQTPPIEGATKKSASARETPIGGASREPLLPGSLREPGLREEAVRAALGSGHTGEREFPFYLFFLENYFPKQRARYPQNDEMNKGNMLTPA